MPAFWCGIVFGELTFALQILFHIIFLDLVASGFLARILTRDCSAFQQIQRCWFTDVADTIELLFGNNVGNFIPVDRSVIFHSNTPFKLYLSVWGSSCVYCQCVLICVCSLLSSLQNALSSLLNAIYDSIRTHLGKWELWWSDTAKSLILCGFQRIQSYLKMPAKISKCPEDKRLEIVLSVLSRHVGSNPTISAKSR